MDVRQTGSTPRRADLRSSYFAGSIAHERREERDRVELLLRPMMPPQSDYHALHVRALYIERGLPLSVPFPHSSQGVTVQRDNGALARLAGVEVTSMGVTVLAEAYQAIVLELRREAGARGWVWNPGARPREAVTAAKVP